MPTRPDLPPSGALQLPGRGRTWVYDSGPAGGRPPLLLLHGWTSTAALNWYKCIPALVEQYRVVALDHRGHGRGIRSRLPFRLEDCADDAAAVVEALDLGPCTVAGYSMGGPIAQLLWRRHPQAVSELVLCATAARFPMRQINPAIAALGTGAVLSLSLVPPAVRRMGMGYAASRWTSSRQAAQWATDEWRRHDPAALVQAGLALSRFDSTPWIGAADVPVALVVTDLDTTVPTRRQHELMGLIPQAGVFHVEGDHRVCVDEPDKFVPALLAACQSVRSAPSAPSPTQTL